MKPAQRRVKGRKHRKGRSVLFKPYHNAPQPVIGCDSQEVAVLAPKGLDNWSACSLPPPSDQRGPRRKEDEVLGLVGAGCMFTRPEGARLSCGNLSVPHVSLVELNPMLLQEPTKLLLKRLGMVMSLLILDVSPHGCELRLSDRERSVSTLPCKC